MNVEQFGYVSDTAFVFATVVYALAMLAHVAEWASARRVEAPAEQVPVREPELVGAGAPSPAATAGSVGRPAEELREEEIGTEKYGRVGLSLTVLAFLTHLVGVGARAAAAGRAPWGNMFEFATTGALAVTAAYLVALRLYRTRWLGLLVTVFVTTVLGIAMLTPAIYVAPGPLVPALHSYWLVIHVAAAAIAGGAFCVGALASLLYLAKGRAERRTPEGAQRLGYLWRLPGSAEIDRVAYKVHAFALPLWTFAVLAGAIWAEYAWGRYWGWDPKETWAFITWVVYAAYLHARATAGWQGRNAAVIALIGFVTFLFNFIGINLFGSGLHSYAGVG
ncbi:MAG: c-type cytochrome biogenesis protein CcsB [Actinomycetota bacterium]|nr:c-type cytochrome biogenesis protein CcsB [Actinomycetota bacterium]